MKINFILVAFLILSASAVAQQIADSPSTEASLASTLPLAISRPPSRCNAARRTDSRLFQSLVCRGLRTAAKVRLRGGLTLRAITAPYFLGTKIDAFRGRGRGDYFASHDLEDFITVVDGRTSLLDEVEADSADLRRFVGEAVGTLLVEPRFLDALPGYLLPDEGNQARIAQLVEKLRALSRLYSVS